MKDKMVLSPLRLEKDAAPFTFPSAIRRIAAFDAFPNPLRML
jgi:hypothetical protein